jgi:hypothetical protein
MLFQDILTCIESHLHELALSRPIIIANGIFISNVTITVDDFSSVAGWNSLGDVLTNPALTELVVADLAIIANERLRITK